MPFSALLWPQSFFAERFFALFDSDGSGTITLQELQEALTLFIHGNPNSGSSSRCMTLISGKGSLKGSRGLRGRGQRESAHLSAVPNTGLFSPGEADGSPSVGAPPLSGPCLLFVVEKKGSLAQETNALDSTHPRPEFSFVFFSDWEKKNPCYFFLITLITQACYEHFR